MKVLVIIAQEGFRDEEYFEPKKVLEKSGHEVVTGSLIAGPCVGKLGGSATADVGIGDVNPDEYDAVAFIGGPGASVYYENATAHAIAKAFFEAGKPTCAICIAPGILAKAGVLTGKRATTWESGDGEHSGMIEAGGGTYTGEDVTVDGNIITANGPHAAKRFGKKIVQLLG